MRYRLNRTAAVMLIALAPLIQGGCSAIGYGLGSAIDSRKGVQGDVPESKWTSLSTGQPVRVIRDTGSFITGQFHGVTRVSDSNYRRRYDDWRRTDSARYIIPAPGDSVVFGLATGEVMAGQLVGYDRSYPDRMHAQSGRPSDRRLATALRERPEGVLLISSADSAGVMLVSTRSLSRVAGRSGQSLSATEISEMITDHKLPTVSALLIMSDSRVWNVPVDGIHRVEATGERGSARWVGFGIGLACDIALIAAIIAFRDWGNWGTGGIHGI